MKNLTAVLFSALALLAAPALAGPFDDSPWKEGQITQILDSTDGLKDLITEYRNNHNLGQDVRDTIDAYIEELRRTVSEDQDGLVAFLGDGSCGSGSPGALFHDDLSDFLEAFQTLGSAFREVDTNPFFESDLDIEFGPPSRATCTVLFPMAKMTTRMNIDFALASQWIKDMAENVSTLATFAKENQCNIIVDHEDAISKAAAAVTVAGILLENFGAKMKTKKEKDGNVAIWGWIGFTVKVATARKMGEKADSYGDSAKALSDFIGTKLRHCQLTVAQEIIMENQRQILNNQEALLAKVEGECWTPPGQAGRTAN